MNARPLVSIVTPSYNQGIFIEETIQSVLTQDYPHIEYIVMDGGSTDGTREILEKYNGKLRWYSARDNGQTEAINKGFQRAKGEIWSWINSDDMYLPGAVTTAVDYFQSHPEVGMVYGEGYHVGRNGEILERYYTEPFDFERLAEICFICQPTTFFRADAIKQVGYLDVSLRYCMDYDLWFRLAKSFRIEYLNTYFAKSRLYEDTKTLGNRVAVHEEIIRCVKEHYGPVPARWIWAFAHCWLDRYLPRNTPLRNKVYAIFVYFLFLQKYLRVNRRIPIEEMKAKLNWMYK